MGMPMQPPSSNVGESILVVRHVVVRSDGCRRRCQCQLLDQVLVIERDKIFDEINSTRIMSTRHVQPIGRGNHRGQGIGRGKDVAGRDTRVRLLRVLVIRMIGVVWPGIQGNLQFRGTTQEDQDTLRNQRGIPLNQVGGIAQTHDTMGGFGANASKGQGRRERLYQGGWVRGQVHVHRFMASRRG